MRNKRTTVTALAGCYQCGGMDAIWTASNAVATAARHHDATGHNTWADQTICIRYGDNENLENYTGPYPELRS